ncbi:MAG TPA: carboxypeptidase-like regulatory domain-containing protein [Chryseolinea sp.]
MHLKPKGALRMVLSDRIKNRYFILLLVMLPFPGVAQRITHGIVVDSASLSALPGVHVKIKNSDRGTSTNSKGEFFIPTKPTDTLFLTRVGYIDLVVPLLFEEEDILIRLKERVRILKEITITATRLNPSEIVRSTRTAPRKMSTADAFSSPWDYFTRGEKDKRKVTKLINENNRIKTYIEVIHDQLLREDIMHEMQLSETEYYATLAQFNMQSKEVLYSTDKSEIISALKSFFRQRPR